MRVFPYAVKVRWGGLRVEAYKPNAVDADHDGIIQEGTIWERPAGARMLDRLGKEIASRTPPPSADPFDFSPRTGMRIVDADGKDLDYTPSWETGGLVPDVTGPADSSIGGGGKRTVGEMSGTVGEITSGLSPAEQEQSRMQREAAEKAAADLAEAQAQVGTDRGGKPSEHDPYVPLTPEQQETGREGVAGAREALARGEDPLAGGVPDPAAEGTAHEDIVWDEAGRKWADLTEEEQIYLIGELARTLADTQLTDFEQAENDGELLEPVGEESRNLKAIREMYAGLQAERARAAMLLTLGNRPSQTDIPDGLGTALGAKGPASISPEGDITFPISPNPAEKEKGRSKDFFYKMFDLAKALWGGSSLGEAENILREGIDDPESGRRIIFVGKEPDLSADLEGDQHLIVLDGSIPMLGSKSKSYADYSDLTMLPSKDATEARDGVPGEVIAGALALVPDWDGEKSLDEQVAEMVENGQLDLDDPNADIPMELLYLAIRERLKEEGSQKAQDNAIIELSKKVRKIGRLFIAEVRERTAAADERGPEENRLSEFFSRSAAERIALANVEARQLTEHARRILKFDLDHFDHLHIEHPLVAQILNESMRRAVVRVLGREPEWTRRDRSDPPDPEATEALAAARVREDAPGGAPDWETQEAAWNGSPEYLFQALIEELVKDFETDPDMTEEEFLKKLENLDDDIAAAFQEELAIEVGPKGGRETTTWSGFTLEELYILKTALFSTSGEREPGAIGTSLDGLERRTGTARRTSSERKNFLEPLLALYVARGMISETDAAYHAILAGQDEEKYLKEFLEELEFKELWIGGSLQFGLNWEAPGEAGTTGPTTLPVVPARAFTEDPTVGATWLEIGYRNALADATRMAGPDGRVGVLQKLRDAGRLKSVVTGRNQSQVAIELLRELLPHGSSDEVRAAMYDGTEGRRERLAELTELSLTGTLSYEDKQELRFLQLKTPGELEGTFDHVIVGVERSGESRGEDVETLLNRLETVALIRSPREQMTPDSDEHVVHNAGLEQQEQTIESVLRFVPLRLIEKLSGSLGIVTHTFDKTNKVWQSVLRAGQRLAQVHDGAHMASQPYGSNVLHLPAAVDPPTAFHEVIHALITGNPVALELLMAYMTGVTDTEEDGLRGWNHLIKNMADAAPSRGRGIAGADAGEYFVDVPGHEGFVYSHRVYIDMSDPYIRENVSKLVDPKTNKVDIEKAAKFYDEHHTYDEGRIRFIPAELITMVMETLLSPEAYASLDIWGGKDTNLAEYIFGLLLTSG